MDTSLVRPTGPLAMHVDGLCTHLADLGYAPRGIRHHEQLLRALSRWLDGEGLDSTQLTEEALERFADQRRAGYAKPQAVQGLARVIAYLRDRGAVPATMPANEGVEKLLDAYAHYMRVERRLAPLTVHNTVGVLRRFLSQRKDKADLSRLDVAELHRFVLSEAARLSAGSIRALAGALRPFLRFLFTTGRMPRDLAGTIPSVAGSRLASLPKAVEKSVVDALLWACDRTTAGGRRDFAIITLLVRLGLRANEVAALRLEDLDWRAGEMVVRGKGGRLERLPLPADVGDALVEYLRHGRPASTSRAVFLRERPPAGEMSRNAVVLVPREASRRAGIAVVGSHRLRHTAATEMLRRGASLAEVGQVLRHDSDTTTSIYAKVDRAALDGVARAWPEVAR